MIFLSNYNVLYSSSAAFCILEQKRITFMSFWPSAVVRIFDKMSEFVKLTSVNDVFSYLVLWTATVRY